MRNMYTDAIEVQNASNLSGILRSWIAHLDAIRAEGRDINAHPVNVLFADKVYSLMGYGSRYSEAYVACEAESSKATARESVSA